MTVRRRPGRTAHRAPVALAVAAVLALGQLAAQAPPPEPNGGPQPARGVRLPAINEADLKEWLTYLASDELQGRQVFTEGYGIAAQYIAERLREFGVKPLGDHGTYFQIVKLRSYKVVRNSSITIEANGRSTTFRDGDHVRFPASAGGKQTLSFDGAQMVGAAPAGSSGRDVRGQLVLLMSPTGRGQGVRGGAVIGATGAGAAIEYAAALRPPQAGPAADIPPTTRRVDGVKPPTVMADEIFFSALLASSPVRFADLKGRLDSDESPPPFTLSGVRVTISVDNVYQPVTTQLSRNVVGFVQGTDPKLKDTYVLFGAHLDHVGYATTAQDVRGKVNAPIETDNIWNGADDDGTGSTAVLAIAKAFATGPKPKRSVAFVWHTGEEANLYGSLFNADFPIVPLERVQCELNIDMIGRNRDNDPAQRDTLFVIGADRISTDLHNLIVDTNATFRSPLRLDYEYNDPGDPNSFYTRSDHFSYASKGLPIAFFFTGTHADYHANTDSADKILFDKQARVAQLVYQVGFSITNSDRDLRRDNRGPRSGKGFSGRLR